MNKLEITYLDNDNNKHSDDNIINMSSFNFSSNDEIINQYNIGDIIRNKIKSNDSLEFVRYKEKKNTIKFTCKNEENIFFGKFDIIAGQGLARKLEIYPIYRNAQQYKDIIFDLYFNKHKTQKQIANRLCLSQTTISRIINQFK